MKSLRFFLISILIWLVAPAGHAQNAPVFPGRAATNQDLLVASNLYSTSLTSGIAADATLIPVITTSGLALPAVITIGQEIIQVCSTSGSAFVVCANGRGFDGTFAAPAPALSKVAGLVIAWHHNQLAAEVIAVENAPHFAVVTSAGQLPGSCTATQLWLLTPAGTIYTCQNGVPGIAGSGAPATLSWSTLTSSQWAALTSSQWSTLTP